MRPWLGLSPDVTISSAVGVGVVRSAVLVAAAAGVPVTELPAASVTVPVAVIDDPDATPLPSSH